MYIFIQRCYARFSALCVSGYKFYTIHICQGANPIEINSISYLVNPLKNCSQGRLVQIPLDNHFKHQLVSKKRRKFSKNQSFSPNVLWAQQNNTKQTAYKMKAQRSQTSRWSRVYHKCKWNEIHAVDCRLDKRTRNIPIRRDL